MPSITYWNRIEPSMRSNDVSKSLAARLRDPLWMLTRQWQFGECHGEDAGSPAWVEIKTSSLPMAAWRVPGALWQAIDSAIPLEKAVQSESFTFNLSVSVELGQLFEAMLIGAGFTDALIADFRDAYPIEDPTTADQQSGDPDFFRFKSVAAGRALNGEELYRIARASLPNLPNRPQNLPNGIATVLEDYVQWVNDVLGDLAKTEAPAWISERLEYGVEVITAAPQEEGTRLYFSDPGRDAEFDWDTFDLVKAIDETAPGVVEEMTETILPANVRFSGMPNARWWDFENATIDFGAIEPDRRELAKLVVMDFMLIHSNDWFVIPLEQKIGTVLRVDSLIVKDVFGTLTLIPPVEESRWTIFSSSGGGRGFVLPPTAGETAQYSAAIEDIRFIRDEMANMVWGVEHTIEGGLGQPLDGYERTSRRNASPPAVPSTPNSTEPPLRYILQTTVPENWIPFLPVAMDPVSGAVALERAAMLRTGTLDPIRPVGRILNPTLAPNTAFRIAEEEVSRTGTRIQRVVGRSRGTRGGTFLWISRRKSAGRGEGSSGLRYDLAQPNTAP